MGRLVVITAENMASCRIVRPLIDRLGSEIGLIMLVPNMPVDTTQRRHRAWRMIKSASFYFLALKMVEIHVHHAVAWLHGMTIRQYARRRAVTVRRYSSIGDPGFFADLRDAAPLYVLSAGPAILSNAVIDAAPGGTLNCHGARIPEYQGAANYIWMINAGEKTAYTTIQRMTYDLDAGPVLAERPIAIEAEWSAYRLNYELSGAGGELYADTVARFLQNGPLRPLVRPDAVASNRGIPGRLDMRAFFAAGRKLLRPREILTLV